MVALEMHRASSASRDRVDAATAGLVDARYETIMPNIAAASRFLVSMSERCDRESMLAVIAVAVLMS